MYLMRIFLISVLIWILWEEFRLDWPAQFGCIRVLQNLSGMARMRGGRNDAMSYTR